MTLEPVHEGVVSRHLNRRLSRPLARMLSHTPVTPNQVSTASLGIALLSFLSFAYGFPAGGGILAQVSSIVDGADGDLARMKGMTSSFGGFLDAVLDRYSDALILLGVIIWTITLHSEGLVWMAGFWALVGTLVFSYTRARPEGTPHGRFDRGVTSVATRDVRLLIVMIGAVTGQGLATLFIIAGLTHTVVTLRLLQVRRSLVKSARRGEDKVAESKRAQIH